MNESIFQTLNNLAGQHWLVDKFFIFCAGPLGFLLLGGLLVFLAMHKDKKKGARDLVVVVTAAACAWGIAHVIKYLYPHARPSELFGTNVLVLPDDIQSFPSGHATFFSALATVLYFYHKKLAVLYGLGALLIGFSRIIVGIHWPLDILAGYILGGLIGVVVYFSYQKWSGVRGNTARF